MLIGCNLVVSCHGLWWRRGPLRTTEVTPGFDKVENADTADSAGRFSLERESTCKVSAPELVPAVRSMDDDEWKCQALLRF